MKKAMVTKVTKFDKVDSYGNTSYSIEFVNADKGFYSTKNPDKLKFKVGEEIEYNIEAKEGQKGTYYKITLPQSEGNQWGGKKQPEPRIQMISFAAAYTKDLIVAGKVQLGDFDSVFDKMYNKMISKI